MTLNLTYAAGMPCKDDPEGRAVGPDRPEAAVVQPVSRNTDIALSRMDRLFRARTVEI